ncbi:MAG: LPS export ABC transporter ATP-binding protein [Rickettsiaceae bacterium]|nr:LPS export ABC transporter ATP-binding protein [Rickettsiaceae bacterium]
MTLKAENISKSYNKRKVVNSINLEVNRGEAVALLGPNGAGKTTCFSMIAGLLAVDSGSLYVGNEDITSLPMHMRALYGLCYLPQESSIFRGLNVQDNLLAILEFAEKDKSLIKRRLEILLGDFGISHLRFASSAALSGGERRRVEIARALAMSPKFMLLDEPLAGIDPIAINDVKNLIHGLKAKNLGILITDHNVRETLDIVDRAYVIFEGKIIFSGSPKEVSRSKIVRQVYLGDNFDL